MGKKEDMRLHPISANLFIYSKTNPRFQSSIYDVPSKIKCSQDTIYVINTKEQFLHWQSNWYGKAVIAQDIAEKFFPSAFDQKWRIYKD